MPVRPRIRAGALPLLLATLLLGIATLPCARALAEEAPPGGDDSFGGLGELISEVEPGAVFTHEKGNAVWTVDTTVKAEPNIERGIRGTWAEWEPGYWENCFAVKGSEGVLPKYSIRIPGALSWVDPVSGKAEAMDFDVEYEAIEAIPQATRIEVQQRKINGFFTYGIRKSKVTYRFYRAGTEEAINPGQFVYWCRSLNPGEAVTFSKSENPAVNLERVYLTDKGLYDNPNADLSAVAEGSHWGQSSVSVSTDPSGDSITFTGSPYLKCKDQFVMDVADEDEDCKAASGHVWVPAEEGEGPHNSLSMHGMVIPYREYVEYRAVTFDVSPADASSRDAGLTLDYTTTGDFYWEMEFNGILTPREAPVKSLPTGDEVKAGGTVTFAVRQSLEGIRPGLIDELVFEDPLPKGLEFVSASMAVNGTTLPEDAGELSVDEGLLTYRFSEATLESLDYGGEDSACTLTIELRVPENAAEGTMYTNQAKVTINGDAVESNPVTVSIPEPQKPSIDVEQPEGALTIAKRATTPTHDGKAHVGDHVDYDILVVNASGHDAEGVEIRDALPRGLMLLGSPRLTDRYYVDLAVSDCKYVEDPDQLDGFPGPQQAEPGGTAGSPSTSDVWNGAVTANIGTLGAGDRVHVLVKAEVGPDALNTLTNAATVQSGTHDLVGDEATIRVLRPGEDDDSGGGDSGGDETDDPNAKDPDDGDDGSGSKEPDTSKDPNGKDPDDSDNSKDKDPDGSKDKDSGDTDSNDKDPDDSDGKGSGDSGGEDPSNPSDADNPSTGDPDNSGGNSGSQTPGDGSSAGGGSTGGSGTGTTGGGTGGSSGNDGGTGSSGMGATTYPVPYYVPVNGTAATTAATDEPQAKTDKGAKRPLPQTDAPPLIGLATTGGIGMTGALVAHTIWHRRNHRR